MVNIGLIQLAAEPLHIQTNLSKAEQYITQTAKDGADLVVLPEMFSVGFSTREKLFTFGEDLDGCTVIWLKDQAEKYNIYIITSIYEKCDGYFYNTMVLVGSDRSLQIYRKRIPTCQERIVWKRDEEPGPGIFETPFGCVRGVICFPTREDDRPDAGPWTGRVLWRLEFGGEPWLWSVRPEELDQALEASGWTNAPEVVGATSKHGVELYAVATK